MRILIETRLFIKVLHEKIVRAVARVNNSTGGQLSKITCAYESYVCVVR